MAYPQVGEIIVNPNYPAPVQPGGTGTAVTAPAQNVDEKNGKFNAGCGHSFNQFEVLQGDEGGVSVAYICCPVCRYLQRKVTPYDLIHTDPAYEFIQG